jgi:hypothetical protein
MKYFLTLIFSFSVTTVMAQEEFKASPPVIVAKISLGETVNFEDGSITFLKVIEDSRCPKDVDCIWAGQAKVLVAIESNGTTTEKELIFHGINFGTAHENTLFVSETKTYIGYRLSPYPLTTEHADKRNYRLKIYMK